MKNKLSPKSTWGSTWYQSIDKLYRKHKTAIFLAKIYKPSLENRKIMYDSEEVPVDTTAEQETNKRHQQSWQPRCN